MEHTFKKIVEVLKNSPDWGDLEEKKDQKIKGLEMQLMRI